MLSRVACLAAFAVLAACASAKVIKESMPGTYERAHGAKTCPAKLRIDRAAHIRAVGAKNCITQPIDVKEPSQEEGNQITMLLSGDKPASTRSEAGSAKFGPFMMAIVKTTFNCREAGFSLEKDTVMNFFSPQKDYNMNYTEVFSKAMTAANPPHGVEGHDHAKEHKLVAKYNCGVACQRPVSGASVSETVSTARGETPRPNAAVSQEAKAALSEVPPTTLKANVIYMSVGKNCMYFRTKAESCFPAHSTVLRRDGARIRMDELRVGDEVAVGRGIYSRVLMWTHRDASAQTAFIHARVASGAALSLSPGHFVYANGKASPAIDLKVGDMMRTADGKDSPIVEIEIIGASGLYNPQTAHGDIAVDGLVATTYTTAVAPSAAHALLSPVRSVFAAAARALAWLGAPVRSEL